MKELRERLMRLVTFEGLYKCAIDINHQWSIPDYKNLQHMFVELDMCFGCEAKTLMKILYHEPSPKARKAYEALRVLLEVVGV